MFNIIQSPVVLCFFGNPQWRRRVIQSDLRRNRVSGYSMQMRTEGFLHSPSKQQLICVGGWPQRSPSAASGIALADDDIPVEDELLDQGWTLSYVRCTKRAFECPMDRCRERKSTRGGCGQPKKRLRNWSKSSSEDRMDGGDLFGCHIISMANISIWFGSRKEYMAPEPSTPERPQKIGTGIITINVISCFAHWGMRVGLGWDWFGSCGILSCQCRHG